MSQNLITYGTFSKKLEQCLFREAHKFRLEM